MGISAGAAMLLSSLVSAGASMYDASQIEPPKIPEPVPTPVDKTTLETEKELEALQIGGSTTKTKKATAKSKFKVPRTTSSSGTNIPAGSDGVGVQI